ncbi:MAG: transcriptional regulator [Alphaproteobacteria bacterium]|nr:transcriptional regulator [Alphaproteobacteria bacterium]
MIYRFDDVEIDTDRFELRRSGELQKVEPQVFALIEFLVENRARMVSKDELNQRIWGGRFVSDAAVNSRIRSARQAIGDDGKAQRLIKTVHGRGFRFVGEAIAEDTVASDFFAAGDIQVPDAAPVEDTGATAAAGRPSIAVLPFQMFGADQQYSALGDALAHDVTVELARLRWLFVISRGSSFRFRGPDADLHSAGTVLGVRYILTGNVAIEGNRSVVTAELSHVEDGGILWADRFEGAIDDLLGLRLTLAASIVTAIEVRIPMDEASRAAALPTTSLDSWSAYHRGLWHMFRFNAHDNEIAARLFHRALEVDKNFARAHAGLSFTHFQDAFVGYAKDTETARHLAKEHAETGMALDPLDPFANLTMGRAIMLAGDMDSAVSWFDRSAELNPNFAFAIYNRALADAVIGRGSESERGAMKAISLSPLDPLHYAMLSTRALSHIVRGDYREASIWGERGAKAPNAHIHIKMIAAIAHELAGNRQAAERWTSDVKRIDPRYEQKQFFAAFPFYDEDTLATVGAALKRLGI